MTRVACRSVVWAAVGLAASCGGRSIVDVDTGGTSVESTAGTMASPTATSASSSSGAGVTTSAADDASGGGSSESGEPIVECHIGYPWIECDVCTDVAVDRVNCGACDQSCRGSDGKCVDYECQPALWPCHRIGTNMPTCQQACGWASELCSEDSACAGTIGLYLTDGPDDTDIRDELQACEYEYKPDMILEGITCTEKLDWDLQFDGRTIVGIACCCNGPY